MIHELKIWPEYFEAVKAGKKTSEVRTSYGEFAEGDDVVLREYDPEQKDYTGRSLVVTLTYVCSLDRVHYPSVTEALISRMRSSIGWVLLCFHPYKGAA